MPQFGQPGAPWGGQVVGGGGMPVSQPLGAQIAMGIGSFLENYRAAKEADKQKNTQKFLDGMRLMQLGIPVDKEKLAKFAQKADLPLDFTGPSQQEIDYQKQKTAYDQGQQMPQTQVPQGQDLYMTGGQIPGPSGASPVPFTMPPPAMLQRTPQPPGPLMAPTPGGAPMQVPAANIAGTGSLTMPGGQMGYPQAPSPGMPPPLPAQPGMFGKFANAMGWQRPPVSPASPGMRALDILQARAQDQAQTQQLQGNYQKATLGLMLQGIKGDPKANEMLRATGIIPRLGTLDEMTMFLKGAGYDDSRVNDYIAYHLGGGPEMTAKLLNLNLEAKKMDFDQRLKTMEQGTKLLELYPGANPNVAAKAATATIMGDAKSAQVYREMLGKSKGTMEMMQKQAELGVQMYGHNVAAKGHELTYGAAMANVKVNELRVGLDALKEANDVSKGVLGNAIDLMMKPSPSGESSDARDARMNAGRVMFNDALTDMAGRTFEIGGKKIPMSSAVTMALKVPGLFWGEEWNLLPGMLGATGQGVMGGMGGSKPFQMPAYPQGTLGTPWPGPQSPSGMDPMGAMINYLP